MISIEIPTVGEPALGNVLESIRNQTCQDYEVLVLDSSDHFAASDLATRYGAVVIKKRCRLLEARRTLHASARGDHALLLDSTRMLSRNAIEVLSAASHDMEIIKEREAGGGALRGPIDLDRAMAFNSIEMDYAEAYALPRYFRSSILSETFSSIMKGMGNDFHRITGEDHKVIFIEARKISSSIGLIRDPLIMHMGDNRVMSIFFKAVRYGMSASIASRHYPQVKTRRLRNKKGLKVQEKASVLMLYAVQMSGYALGYFLQCISGSDPA